MIALLRFFKNIRPGVVDRVGVGGGLLTGTAADFSPEAHAAIEAAQIILRSCDDEGERAFVVSPVLRGSFIYCRNETAQRIARAFPELSPEGVRRAVLHLENRVRLASRPVIAHERRNWVTEWNK